MKRGAIAGLLVLALSGCASNHSATRESASVPPVRVSSADPARTPESTPDTRPSTQPTGTHSVERFRLVNQKDEVVSVLDNGLTVIAKRVASPVVSVRAYVHTGGIYEGPWLGGGLSHLLEHLVAGGTNDRRTEAQNRDLLQSLGNDSNAYTTTDHTSYFVNTTTEHMPRRWTWSRAGCWARRSRRRSTGASTRSCSASWRWARASPT